MMMLKELLAGVEYTVLQGSDEVEITAMCSDSRKAAAGTAFFCIVGYTRDSHDFAADVAAKGAAALVVSHAIPLETVPGVTVVQVADGKYAQALASCNWFGRPTEKLTMIGVTGTKGKTTTAHMIKAILEHAGKKVGIMGTVGVAYPGFACELNQTTPESYEMQQYFADMVRAGVTHVVMEVSSQGIMNQRVAGIQYEIGVFTNLYPDHIGGVGEHKTFEEYRQWKGELFRRCRVGVVNADDPNTEALLEGSTCELVRYGMETADADYRADGLELLRSKEILGIRFHVSGRETMDVRVNMPGAFSVYNSLAAIAVGHLLNVPTEAIHAGLTSTIVKGRVEVVPVSSEFTILIDFAHNEESTHSLLSTLSAYHPQRMVVLFGCGGNRSRLRRYGMGEVASKMADLLILTEDNNRDEDVMDIIADIHEGIAKGNPDVPYVEIPDRLDAIHYAMDHAQPGDLICVIGKGHETYRLRKGIKTPFHEREIIEAYAAELGLR